MSDYHSLPDDLPRPVDDGAADHVPGMPVPDLTLPGTDGTSVSLADLAKPGEGRTVLYLYPLSGRPGVALPDGWDEIPGARGCTPETCGFRDHFADLRTAGAAAVHGLSSQDSDYQREFAERLGLPFTLLSDSRHELADALGLPTFEADGMRLYKRMTLVLSEGVVEHVFYPVFPPDEHGEQVLAWLRG